MTAYVLKGRAIFLSTSPAPVGVAITAATKAKPCVLTVTNTAAVDDIIRVEGSGFAALDGRAFKVSVASGTSVTLEASDTTGETATFDTDAKAFFYNEVADMVETCLSAFSYVREPAATIVAGTFCSTTTLTGATGSQSVEMSGYDDPESPGMAELMRAQDDGEPRVFLYKYPTAASSSGASYEMILPSVTIGGFSGPLATADGAVTFTCSGTSNGKPSYTFLT